MGVLWRLGGVTGGRSLARTGAARRGRRRALGRAARRRPRATGSAAAGSSASRTRQSSLASASRRRRRRRRAAPPSPGPRSRSTGRSSRPGRADALQLDAALLELAQAARAAQEVALDRGSRSAGTGWWSSCVQPRLGRLHLELALAHVLEVLGRAQDHVDDRADEREQRRRRRRSRRASDRRSAGGRRRRSSRRAPARYRTTTNRIDAGRSARLTPLLFDSEIGEGHDRRIVVAHCCASLEKQAAEPVTGGEKDEDHAQARRSARPRRSSWSTDGPWSFIPRSSGRTALSADSRTLQRAEQIAGQIHRAGREHRGAALACEPPGVLAALVRARPALRLLERMRGARLAGGGTNPELARERLQGACGVRARGLLGGAVNHCALERRGISAASIACGVLVLEHPEHEPQGGVRSITSGSDSTSARYGVGGCARRRSPSAGPAPTTCKRPGIWVPAAAARTASLRPRGCPTAFEVCLRGRPLASAKLATLEDAPARLAALELEAASGRGRTDPTPPASWGHALCPHRGSGSAPRGPRRARASVRGRYDRELLPRRCR